MIYMWCCGHFSIPLVKDFLYRASVLVFLCVNACCTATPASPSSPAKAFVGMLLSSSKSTMKQECTISNFGGQSYCPASAFIFFPPFIIIIICKRLLTPRPSLKLKLAFIITFQQFCSLIIFIQDMERLHL